MKQIPSGMETEFRQNRSRNELMLHTTSNLKQDSEENQYGTGKSRPVRIKTKIKMQFLFSVLCLSLSISVCVCVYYPI